MQGKGVHMSFSVMFSTHLHTHIHTKALIEFENVLAMEPKNYVGDNLARITDMYRVAQYNVACCYSVLGQTEAGLEALNNALKVGFEDYSKVRSDPNLANLRENPKYKLIVDKYDEPIINEEALKYVEMGGWGLLAD